MRETAALIGDVDEPDWAAIRAVINVIGAASVEALKPVVMVEGDSLASRRAEEVIVGFRAAAVGRLTALISDSRWYVQRNGARILGRIGSPQGVPLLQPLLRQTDPRVARQAVAALGAINDPTAARAIHTVLRASSGNLRRAVVDALVAERDPRVVPMLLQILRESQLLGKDHDVALETIAALGTVGSDEAVPALLDVARQRRLFGGKKLRALKARSVGAIVSIGGAKAAAALDEASRTADRMLKKVLDARAK
jgi:HEAT repeat protein